jgi:hypothetical protein
MNKWRIAFWCCLTTLLIVVGISIYSTIDQGYSLSYLQDSYTEKETELDNLVLILNETDLSKTGIEKTLKKHKIGESANFKRDTVSLDELKLIFRNDKLLKVTRQ